MLTNLNKHNGTSWLQCQFWVVQFKINLGDTYCDIEGYLCFLQRRVLRLSILRGNIQGRIARDIQGGENRMSNEKHFEKATL
jgi:hypothetical protein